MGHIMWTYRRTHMIFLFKGYIAIHMYSLKNAVKSDLLVAKKKSALIQPNKSLRKILKKVD